MAGSGLPEPVDLLAAGARPIAAEPFPDWIVLDDGSAWVSGIGVGIGRFDATGRLTGVVPVDRWCMALDVSFGAVWSARCDPAALLRIDSATATVRTMELPDGIADEEASVGLGEGSVWLVVGSERRRLVSVDPDTLTVTGVFDLAAGSAPVRAGLGGVWVVDTRTNTLQHVDPSSGATIGKVQLGRGARFLALGHGSVWVMNQLDGTVSRVDPTTDQVIATIAVGLPIRGGDIACGGASVWVRGNAELLARIDPEEHRVTQRFGPPAGSGGVAADAESVWVTAHDIKTIWRLPLS
jgi:YVTN family beta-propeller protein